ncbi:hypothetical protein [Cytobacillus praedii]|uniref:hypothetical protein n=1 Tax=Cytobacillus praedii TaxID=1742358 RepID=UPI000AA983A2|nr:hypothetical protein [Cytobacillus praedii]
MGKPKNRQKGDSYRPTIEVLKAKNGVPTSIRFNGQSYALVHQDYINGRKNQA